MDPPYPSCWENLRIEALDYPLTLDEGQFQLAFLELYVAIESDAHGYWAQLGISTPASSGQDFFLVGALTLAANVGYRRYQVPLRVLSGETGVLSKDVVNRGIRSFRVGTGWHDGATVRFDGAAIRW